jgi:RimJ/RimL family protein N-acetyltransferase
MTASGTGSGGGHEYPGALDVPNQLVGARVMVRPFQPGDLDAFRGAVEESREHLLPWMPWAQGHRDPRETLHFFARTRADWIGRRHFDGGVFARDTGRLLGSVGLYARDWRVPAFEIGYWLRWTATGRGYMREAAALMTQLAFETLGANRVFICCDARNDRSRRVPDSLGFVFEGRLRHTGVAQDGSLKDHLYFALIPDEYEALRPRWRELLHGSAAATQAGERELGAAPLTSP